MASRLSEESLRAVYDTGHQGLAIQSGEALELLSGPSIDLDKLLLAEDPEAAVAAVAPQPLYQALVRKGPEDALEVLRLLSREQVVRILDYDVWSEDRLVPIKAVRWLMLFKENGPEEMYRRFRELDEEYQLALLGPVIKSYDEDEYEKLSHDEQDSLSRMPCGTIFYRVESNDPRIQEFVSGLLESAMGEDINYAYALLAHAAYLPPNEQEDLIARFRKARLEEDGFVSYDESLAAFRPLDPGELKHKWSFTPGRDDAGLAAAAGADELFLMQVLNRGARTWQPAVFETVSRGFVSLGNMLAAATKVETDDVDGLRRLLVQAQALSSLGLEWLTGGDVQAGVAVLEKETPQILFRTGLSLVARLAEAMADGLARHGLPEAAGLVANLKLGRRGVVVHAVERSLLGSLGLDRVETLKGLFNRFPVQPVSITKDQEGAPRVIFEPVSTRAALARLAAKMDGLAGLLQLAHLAGGPLGGDELDRRLMTSLARVMAGGTFTGAPLSSAEVARLGALPREAMQAMAADFFAGVEGTLRVAMTEWSVSRVAEVPVADPVQATMLELSDLILRLTAALGSAVDRDEVSLVRVLAPLVDPAGVAKDGPSSKETM